MKHVRAGRVLLVGAVAASLATIGVRNTIAARDRLVSMMHQGNDILRATRQFASINQRFPSNLLELRQSGLLPGEPNDSVEWLLSPPLRGEVPRDGLELRPAGERPVDPRDDLRFRIQLVGKIYGRADPGSLIFDPVQSCWVLRPAVSCLAFH